MVTRHIRATRLLKDMVLVLPFGKTATILDDPHVGRAFVTYHTEYGPSRVGIYDEVAIESASTPELESRSQTDLLIEEFAAKAESIYDNRTAGDYTWIGLFAEFARKLD